MAVCGSESVFLHGRDPCLFGSGADDADREIALFGLLCEVAPDTIHELDLADYRQLQEAFRDSIRPAVPATSGGQPPS